MHEIGSIADAERFVGREVLSGWETVTQARIDQFAEAINDRQWIHVDPTRARTESVYGGTIAHGFLTLALLSALHESVVAYPGFAMGINYGFNRLRFTAPVLAGQRVRARFKLTQVERLESAAGRGPGVHFVWHVNVDAEGLERPVLVAEWLTRRYLSG